MTESGVSGSSGATDHYLLSKTTATVNEDEAVYALRAMRTNWVSYFPGTEFRLTGIDVYPPKGQIFGSKIYRAETSRGQRVSIEDGNGDVSLFEIDEKRRTISVVEPLAATMDGLDRLFLKFPGAPSSWKNGFGLLNSSPRVCAMPRRTFELLYGTPRLFGHEVPQPPTRFFIRPPSELAASVRDAQAIPG